MKIVEVDPRWEETVFRFCERRREPDPLYDDGRLREAHASWRAAWRWIRDCFVYAWRRETRRGGTIVAPDRDGHTWQLEGVKLFEVVDVTFTAEVEHVPLPLSWSMVAEEAFERRVRSWQEALAPLWEQVLDWKMRGVYGPCADCEGMGV